MLLLEAEQNKNCRDGLGGRNRIVSHPSFTICVLLQMERVVGSVGSGAGSYVCYLTVMIVGSVLVAMDVDEDLRKSNRC